MLFGRKRNKQSMANVRNAFRNILRSSSAGGFMRGATNARSTNVRPRRNNLMSMFRARFGR